ncbi:MAG: nucleoside kinase [Termitinemataceae bacterium]
MNEIEVRFPDGSSIKTMYGTRVDTLLHRFKSLDGPIVAVRSNNELMALSGRLEVNVTLEPVTLTTTEGTSIYRRSLSFLLAMAAKSLFPERTLVVGHSLGHGYFYTFADEVKPTQEELDSLAKKMKELVDQNLPIHFTYMSYADALSHFTNHKQTDTALLLEQQSKGMVPVNECQGFIDVNIAPLVPRTGILQLFELRAYENGFLLRFPSSADYSNIEPFEDSPRIFAVYREYKKWGRIVGVHSVGNLNALVSARKIKEFIQIAEAFQQKKLSEIADEIYKRRDTVKVVLIAGPSSSGKTTTAKRLAIQMRVMGLDPIPVSLDDYYVNHDKTPLDEEGKPDYECLEALDVAYLNEQLIDLLRGKEVEIPSYDFKTGMRRESSNKKIQLGRRSMLILEGIHGLNDRLTSQIDRDRKFKIYVSALTQLNLDDHNRIPTSDNRLIRRMVRDYQFRGNSAAGTIRMWPSVQRGEKKHIFPFQDTADVAFNSALDYELSVLKVYAEPLLKSVKPTMLEYGEAVRLLAFLENFAPIPPQLVPGQSILREFIGDSEFKY